MSILKRIDEAVDRITSGRGQMRIPPDRTDPDVVLSDARAEIERLRSALKDARVGFANLAADSGGMLADAEALLAMVKQAIQEDPKP